MFWAKRTPQAVPERLFHWEIIFRISKSSYHDPVRDRPGAVENRMGPGAGPRAPSWGRAPSPENRHQKIVTGKSYLKTSGMVQGPFWPKLVKSSCFRPNGRHEQFRSGFFIRKSSGISPKALTTTPFVTDRGPWKIEWAPGPGPGPPPGGIFYPVVFSNSVHPVCHPHAVLKP